MTALCKKRGYSLYMPELPLCGDNGVMVGSQAYYEFIAGHTAGENLNACASMPIDKSYVL